MDKQVLGTYYDEADRIKKRRRVSSTMKYVFSLAQVCILCIFLLFSFSAEAEEFVQLSTIDDSPFQISIKLMDYPDNKAENDFLPDSRYHDTSSFSGLLSGCLGEDGYPTNRDGVSMAVLFADAMEVNHLFLAESLEKKDIWEFDSTQCFAALNESEFILYRELGTIDTPYSTTLDHGQFLPFNTITPGVISNCHPANKYDALGNELPDDDPRKGEPLYAIPANEANHYFGLTLDAAFNFPSDGLTAQGEDLIAYFTADDDLWVYIDGYLILDLGGVHSAIPGSINFSTGEVTYRDADGKDYTTKLYKLFQQRYKEKYPDARERDVQEFLDDLFTENSHWQKVLRDDTIHTIKIIYLERGAGASNLCMRFNLPILEKE